MEDVTTFLWSNHSLQDDVFIKPPNFEKKKESAHTYASFGNNGITASVNAYGHIMQISRYLSFGCSGFLCIDSQYNAPYYMQSRTETILDSSQVPDRGLRLDIMDWSAVQDFSFGFMYDRWPRYVIHKATVPKVDGDTAVPLMQNSSPPTNEQSAPIPNIEKYRVESPAENSSIPIREALSSTSLSIQYYCFENTVIQKYQILVGKSGIARDKIKWGKVSVIPEVSIRSLNFVDWLDFDDEDAEPERRVLSDYSISLVRIIPKEHYEEEESEQHPRKDDLTEHIEQKKEEIPTQPPMEADSADQTQQKEREPKMNTVNRPVAAALIISPFINDRPTNIVDGKYIILDNTETDQEELLVITIAYTVKLLYSDCSGIFEKLPEPAASVDDDHEATSVADAQITGRSVTETVVNADDGHEATPAVDAEATERSVMDADHIIPIADAETDEGPVPNSDVARVPEPRSSPVQGDTHETATIEEKIDLTDKKKKLVDDWASEVMEAMQAMNEVFTKNSTFRRIRFSPHESMDYAFRRNLEHILSVCSIPITTEQNDIPPSLQGAAVAITCGDVSGHRIGPRANLAAVQFLCSLFPYLDPGRPNEARFTRILTEAERPRDRIRSGSITPKDTTTAEATDIPKLTESEETIEHDHLLQLRERVLRVLQGHMVWICARAEWSLDESFHPHHWPNGRRIFNLDWLPQGSLVDTPLQLLKVLHYSKLRGLLLDDPTEEQTKELEWMQQRLRAKARSWIAKIHNINKRGTYAFFDPTAPPRYKWQGTNENAKYRLTDHVMIGLALNSVKELGLEPENQIWPFYAQHEEVRSKILKRFTVEHPISKQRTLATSRWNDETRFLLHTKDIFLFSADGLEYLQDRARAKISSKRKEKRSENDGSIPWKYADRRWAKLLEAQAYHDQFQLLEWDNPLWYALVLILACKGTRVNNETSEALMGSSRDVLLGTASYNGLFAGQLGHKNVPVPFEFEYDRDDYWFRTFETTHILWNLYNTDGTSAFEGKPSPPSSTGVPAPGLVAASKETTRIGQQVEKHVPFTNSGSRTQTGIVVLSDDWLQDLPAFLAFPTEPEKNSTVSIEYLHRNSFPSNLGLSILGEVPERQSSDRVGVIIDVPKWSLGAEISTHQLTPLESLDRLGQQTVWESKKRIVWLPYCDRTVATKCYGVSSPDEKDSLLSFLRRNRERETYFLDSATVVLNEWETELHLSFFGISSTSKGSLHELENSRFIASYTMSLRFSGDFSDRHWVCYFLEHPTSKTTGKTLGQRLSPSRDCGIRGGLGLFGTHTDAVAVSERFKQRKDIRAKRRSEQVSWRQRLSWQQRKVLELLIYSKMLEELRENTNNIFRAVKKLALRSSRDKHSDGNKNPFRTAIDEAKRLQQLGEKEAYASIAREWPQYIQVLTVVEENLTDNIEKMDQWEQRETDRQNEQPRWTDRDEQNHFTTILRLKILTGRQAGDIKRLKDDIRTFRESLPSQLESIREEISFRGSQNINLFTYVTIVFLPLGFATGALSMNGLPSHDLLMKLVYMSLAAFGLTLFALLNARSVKLILPLFFRFPQRFAKHVVFRYLARPIVRLFREHEERKELKECHKRMLITALMACAVPPTAVAALRFGPGQHRRKRGFWTFLYECEKKLQFKYQEIVHFSFLTAVKREGRKANPNPSPA